MELSRRANDSKFPPRVQTLWSHAAHLARCGRSVVRTQRIQQHPPMGLSIISIRAL